MKIYKFRNCLLNTLERRVMRDGKYLEITPRTFDVLQLLVERSGEIDTRDDMLGVVWNGSFVEESNLPVHVGKLRKLLDTGVSQRFIKTVYTVGYRFTAVVRRVGNNEWQRQTSGNGFLFADAPLQRGGNSGNYVIRSELDQAAQVILNAANTIRQLVPTPNARDGK